MKPSKKSHRHRYEETQNVQTDVHKPVLQSSNVMVGKQFAVIH